MHIPREAPKTAVGLVAVSSVCTAFDDVVIGSQVANRGAFLSILREVLAQHDPAADRVPGQHYLQLPEEACKYVSAGVGSRAGRPPVCYVAREHRGHVGLYLQRGFAAPCTGVHAVVYTLEAYAQDPEVSPGEVAGFPEGTTHVIVAVLAFAGPAPQLSPHRFASNLAGGNHEAMVWTADEIRARAVDVITYDRDWCPVAD